MQAHGEIPLHQIRDGVSEAGGFPDLLPLNNLGNAPAVDAHSLGPAKVDDDVIILRRADIPGFLESVLGAVIEPHCERTKRLPLDHALDFQSSHCGSLGFAIGFASRKTPGGQQGGRMTWTNTPKNRRLIPNPDHGDKQRSEEY